MKKKILSLVFVFLVFISTFAAASFAAELLPVEGGNAGFHNYTWYWANPSTSYLYLDGSNVLRVQFLAHTKQDQVPKVFIEKYDRDFSIVSQNAIKSELPIFGGFYSSKEYNFLVFGQNNKVEDSSKEVIRVVKYDKDWNRIAQASLKGANTVIPFDAGNLRFAEHQGILYIRTSHEMYKSKDGLNHQANLTMSIRIEDMVITDSLYEVMYNELGYVSHSFNQFIMVDKDSNLVALDHGDAYPRSIVLTKYYDKAGGEKFVGKYPDKVATLVDVKKFSGAIGENYTGSELGGFVETANNYLIAYNYRDTKETAPNLYLAKLNKTKLSSESVIESKIANNSSNPMLVSLDENSGYLLWNEYSKTKQDKNNVVLHYTEYDLEGNVGEIKTVKGISLSDCQPIKYEGGIIWYSTYGGGPEFYVLGKDGITTHKTELDNPFLDLEKDSWYHRSVLLAYKQGLVKGVSKDEFKPQGVSSRAAFTTVLWRIAGSPNSNDENAFEDVENNSWYSDAVAWAKSLGIVKGVTETLFAPEDEITVEQMITMLYRYSIAKSYNSKVSDADLLENPNWKHGNNYSKYAERSIKWALDKDLLYVDEKLFIPKNAASRAELAYLMQAFYTNIVKD